MILMIIKYIVIMFGIYLNAYLYGIPVIYLLNSKWINNRKIVLCPLCGLSIGMIIMFYLYYIGFGFVLITWILTMIFAVIDIILIAAHKYTLEVKRFNLFCVIGTIVIATVFFSLPGVINNNGGLSLTMGNIDMGFYGLEGNVIKLLNANKIAENVSSMKDIILGIQNRNIMYWGALISVIFKSEDIFNATILIAILSYILAVLAIGLLAYELCSNKKKAIVVGSIFFLNANLLYLYYQGFMGQIISIPYVIIINLVFFKLIEEDRLLVKESILLGILVAGMSTTYAEIIPLVVFPMVIILIVEIINERRLWNNCVKSCTIAMITMAIIYGRGYYVVLKLMQQSNSVSVGWDIRAGYLLQALGIYEVQAIMTMGDCVWPECFVIAISVLILLFMFIGINRKYTGRQKRFLEIYLLTFAGIYILFRVRYDLYKSFKAMAEIAYFFVVIFVVLLLNSEHIKRRRIVLKNSILIIAVVFILRGGLCIYTWVYSASETIAAEGYRAAINDIDENYEELSELLDTENYREIYIVGNPSWENISAAIIATKHSNITPIYDVYELMRPVREDYVPDGAILIEMSAISEPIPIDGEILLKNEIYVARRIDTSYPFCVNRSELGFPIARGGIDVKGKDTNGGIALNKEINDIKFYIDENRECDLHIILETDKENEVKIVMPGGEEEKVWLNVGKNELSYNKIGFLKGLENTIKIVRENNINDSEIYIRALYFDDYQYEEYVKSKVIDMDKYKWLSINNIRNAVHLGNEIVDYVPVNISFRINGNGDRFVDCNDLWSEEEFGQWTRDQFEINFKLREVDDLSVKWSGCGVLSTDYNIKVSCNGEELSYANINDNGSLEDLIIPKEYLKKGKNKIQINIENVTSPAEISSSGDSRTLGIYLTEIQLYLQ